MRYSLDRTEECLVIINILIIITCMHVVLTHAMIDQYRIIYNAALYRRKVVVHGCVDG